MADTKQRRNLGNPTARQRPQRLSVDLERAKDLVKEEAARDPERAYCAAGRSNPPVGKRVSPSIGPSRACEALRPPSRGLGVIPLTPGEKTPALRVWRPDHQRAAVPTENGS